MGALVNLISIVVPLALIVMINQWKATTKIAYCVKWSLYQFAIFSYGLVRPLMNPMFELPAAMPMTNAFQGWLVSSLFAGLVFYAVGLIIWSLRQRQK